MMYRIYSKGIIEVIAGPMFSGKSEELIKRIKILGYAKTPTLVVKPNIDTRWEKGKIFSRAGSSIETVSVSSSKEILEKVKDGKYEAVAIDEVQFLDLDVTKVVEKLAKDGIRVIISGLDTDYLGKPFGAMPKLLAIAELVDKQQAVCNSCGNAATMTYRLSREGERVQIGNKEYEPRCRSCHKNGMMGKK